MTTHLGTVAANQIMELRPAAYKVGLVLGSGLGDFAASVEDAVHVPFARLQGFPMSTVSGHAGEMIVGRIAGVDVVVMSGRLHYYEQGDAATMRAPIETFAALGCSALVLTNSAGSLDPDMGPGELMLVNDHINFAGINPLFRETSDRRFVGMVNAYDEELAGLFRQAAVAEQVRLHEGVYMWFSGPSFETKAEIRAARILGADAVGMSTVPEVILGRFFDMRVAAISTITNLAAGMTGDELSHAETKAVAPQGAEKLARILPRVIAAYAGERSQAAA
ncbi:purine-nucleoside phosphorylase [Methylobrevis pamukkalensis]|uniref:Purine nucleoside phosphorylase n=1 Tax=Methylobrevis pamukkalensis TaxID=1439726 RepID=A0A1E3H3N4_9HYPH|nr:purine-nucleoside phosphorylase [Methylobrevis pamukkalensis]ODN70922.1 Purine nucleoside phosphorylase 2 [Methylobrevis pamukkalensis]